MKSVEVVGVESSARIDAYRPGYTIGRISSSFECFPTGFEKDPLLRIHHLSLFRVNPEKGSVKAFGVLENTSSGHILTGLAEGVWVKTGGDQFVIGENGDRFFACYEIGP